MQILKLLIILKFQKMSKEIIQDTIQDKSKDQKKKFKNNEI